MSIAQHEVTSAVAANAQWSSWQKQVLQRAARQEAQIVDIQAAAGRLLLHVQKERARRRRDEFLLGRSHGLENGHAHSPLQNGHAPHDSLNGHAQELNHSENESTVNGHGLHDSLESGHVGAECGSDDTVSCPRLLSIAEHETEVSRLFLASLFLVSTGIYL